MFLIGCDAEAKGCAFSAREATVSSAYSMSIGLRAGLGFRGRLTSMLGMLRKKPPEGLPNINSGTPWSACDLDELEDPTRTEWIPRRRVQ